MNNDTTLTGEDITDDTDSVLFTDFTENTDTRSNEVIKQLNRLANDRSLTPHMRNKIRDAVQHIRDLHIRLKEFKSA